MPQLLSRVLLLLLMRCRSAVSEARTFAVSTLRIVPELGNAEHTILQRSVISWPVILFFVHRLFLCSKRLVLTQMSLTFCNDILGFLVFHWICLCRAAPIMNCLLSAILPLQEDLAAHCLYDLCRTNHPSRKRAVNMLSEAHNTY